MEIDKGNYSVIIKINKENHEAVLDTSKQILNLVDETNSRFCYVFHFSLVFFPIYIALLGGSKPRVPHLYPSRELLDTYLT